MIPAARTNVVAISAEEAGSSDLSGVRGRPGQARARDSYLARNATFGRLDNQTNTRKTPGRNRGPSQT
jgi:hypothetical protein